MDGRSRVKVRNAGFRVFRLRPEELAIYELTSKGGWRKVRSCENGVLLDRAWRQVMSDPKALKD
ncbi:MAG: hypothetical protein A2Y89_02645 [Chloroflexi bacterium RBG_13_51_18]|nr:MAG: hypothetical protein A2Y89_02645 [Chloroflexi bacterium RBG_13_51_18]